MFCWKNVSSFCSAKATHIFSAKNFRILYIESAKTVNEMTLNELVKLTTLWTTGPRINHTVIPCYFRFYNISRIYFLLIGSTLSQHWFQITKSKRVRLGKLVKNSHKHLARFTTTMFYFKGRDIPILVLFWWLFCLILPCGVLSIIDGYFIYRCVAHSPRSDKCSHGDNTASGSGNLLFVVQLEKGNNRLN